MNAANKKNAVGTWLREVGIGGEGEEMLREYIGEEGGLEEIETLDEEDVQELGAPCLALPSFFLSFCLSFFLSTFCHHTLPLRPVLSRRVASSRALPLARS